MLRRDDGTVRYFTVRETARLQTFPDDMRFHGAWSEVMRQMGNAVPTRLATILAQSIHEALEGELGDNLKPDGELRNVVTVVTN